MTGTSKLSDAGFTRIDGLRYQATDGSAEGIIRSIRFYLPSFSVKAGICCVVTKGGQIWRKSMSKDASLASIGLEGFALDHRVMVWHPDQIHIRADHLEQRYKNPDWMPEAQMMDA